MACVLGTALPTYTTSIHTSPKLIRTIQNLTSFNHSLFYPFCYAFHQVFLKALRKTLARTSQEPAKNLASTYDYCRTPSFKTGGGGAPPLGGVQYNFVFSNDENYRKCNIDFLAIVPCFQMVELTENTTSFFDGSFVLSNDESYRKCKIE